MKSGPIRVVFCIQTISHSVIHIRIILSNIAEFRHPAFNRESTREEVNSQIDRGGKVSVVVAAKKPSAVVAAKKQVQSTKQYVSSLVPSTGRGRPSNQVGIENRYVKQICHVDGCFKYIASHCGGYCMRHFKESTHTTKKVQLEKKTKTKTGLIMPPTKEKKQTTERTERERPTRLRQLKPVAEPSLYPEQDTLSSPSAKASHEKSKVSSQSKKDAPASPKTPKHSSPTKQEASSSSKKINRNSPSPSKTHTGRAKPTKSLYPHSKQNEFSFPTGHAVAHLPAEPAPEFGDGWTTRTLVRANSKGSKSSDTYYYSPVMQFKFRSKIQVEKFLQCLEKSNGDEAKAIFEFKSVSNG